MTKKIVTLFVLCLMLLSLFSMAFSVQPAKGQSETSVPIPAGRNVTVEMNGVHLQFDFVITPGSLMATQTFNYPGSDYGPEFGPSAVTLVPTVVPPILPTGFVKVWDVQVTARFIGHVKVGLFYNDLNPAYMQVWQTDVIDYGKLVVGDVNKDGKVNCADILLVIKALGSSPSSYKWNQCCDLNHDGKINLQDLCIVSQNLGKTAYWIDITKNVDTAHHIVWGVTDHFSIFGVR
jgi:hypothetical protein